MPSLILMTVLAAAPLTLEEGWQNHQMIQRAGMWTLTGWAAANMVAGTTGFLLAKNEDQKWLWLGNAAWNVVNAGIAVGGLVAAHQGGLPDSVYNSMQNTEKAYLFNAGLDVGYIAAGAWLWERGLRKEDLRMKGIGRALIVQGVFLAIFDVVMFAVQRNNRVLLPPPG